MSVIGQFKISRDGWQDGSVHGKAPALKPSDSFWIPGVHENVRENTVHEVLLTPSPLIITIINNNNYILKSFSQKETAKEVHIIYAGMFMNL